MKLVLLLITFAVCCVETIRADGCDKTYTTLNESITIASPSFPTPYPENQTCHYIFQTKKLYIHLKNLNLRPNDTLIIYNGTASNNTTVIQIFTDTLDTTTNQVVLYSMAPNTTIVFTAQSPPVSGQIAETQNAGFELDVKPNNFSFDFKAVDSSVFSSPIYVASPGNMQCDYNLQLKDQSAKIGVSFDHVNIVKGSVLVDGKTYSDGTKEIRDVIKKTSIVNVNFQLSTSVDQDGFRAAYNTLSSDCSSNIIIDDTSVNILSSEGSPGNYSNNLNCRTIIQGPVGSKLWFQFLDFDMGDQYDHVVINDGDSRASRPMVVLNNGNKPKTYLITSGNSMWLMFTTDETQTGGGFRMSVRVVSYGGTYLNEGKFEIKNDTTALPVKGDTEDDIFIQLITYENLQLQVDFSSQLLLPASSIDCYDGLSQSDPHVAQFRTDQPFYPVFTKGHFMLIVVHGFLKDGVYNTNQSLTGNFKTLTPSNRTKYSLDGNDVYQLTETDVDGGNATWLIHKPDTGMVSMKLWYLKVLADHSFNVYSGMSDTSMKILNLKSTDAPQLPAVIYLDSDSRITYDSMPSNSTAIKDNTQQIVLSASTVSIQDCNMNYNSKSGVLTSPSYPDVYPVNANCESRVTQINNKSMHFVFSQLKLADHHTLTMKSKDHANKTSTIVMYDHQTVMPFDVITPTGPIDEIILEFSSKMAGNGNLNTAAGFSVNFNVLECGGNVTDKKSGVIQTPNFPSAVSHNTTCVWIITLPTPAKNNSGVSILNFFYNLKGYKELAGNLLEIKDGGMNCSDNMDVVLKEGVSAKELSRYNQLWVKYTFQAADNKTKGFAFQLNFTSFECNSSSLCGNGICLHPDWKCNGVDNCGDMTDEHNCTAAAGAGTKGIKPWVLGVCIVFTFFIAVIITLLVPVVMRKMRNRNYDDMREVLSPVDS